MPIENIIPCLKSIEFLPLARYLKMENNPVNTKVNEDIPIAVCVVIPDNISELAPINTNVGTIIMPPPTPISDPIIEDTTPIKSNMILAIVTPFQYV